ncbi:hypothetical protein [Polymorphobacter sp.]|uniref:hypothetical protein n=1 Tax=Polymorphobacter sp. TaxID=1909290 RepID=UPI003F72316F
MEPAAGGAADGRVRFDRFVGIDWSGARGDRHPGVQVAMCEGDGPVRLVVPGGGIWSRQGVLDWLGALSGDVLVGMDAGFGFAPAPGFEGPARRLWAEIDAVCADEIDLGGHAFVAHRREAFWMGAADGPRSARAHLRLCERVYAERRLGVPTSNFVLLGASQVGKASLSAMRLLHRLGWAVWPFDPLPASGPVICEIYCQAFARMAGVRGKLRTRAVLAPALAHFGAAVPDGLGDSFADHVGDALVTAAGLRRIAHQPQWWAPAGLTPALAVSEGWTFGVG